MPRTELETAIVTQLQVREDLIPSLWARVEASLSTEVPLTAFYEAIYHLRSEGVVEYQSPSLSNADICNLLTELASDSPFVGMHDYEASMVRLVDNVTG